MCFPVGRCVSQHAAPRALFAWLVPSSHSVGASCWTSRVACTLSWAPRQSSHGSSLDRNDWRPTCCAAQPRPSSGCRGRRRPRLHARARGRTHWAGRGRGARPHSAAPAPVLRGRSGSAVRAAAVGAAAQRYGAGARRAARAQRRGLPRAARVGVRRVRRAHGRLVIPRGPGACLEGRAAQLAAKAGRPAAQP